MTNDNGLGSPELEALSRAVRDLNLAAALTTVPSSDLAAATEQVNDLTTTLLADSRPRVLRERPFSRPGGFEAVRSVVVNRYNAGGPELTIGILAPGHVASTTRMAAIHQGPLDSVHGGISAWLMDTILGVAVQSAGYLCVTGTLSLRYIHRTPLDADLQLEGKVVSKEGRKVHTTASIIHDGTTTVTATGVFIEVAAR